jgi:hypothetical protein
MMNFAFRQRQFSRTTLSLNLNDEDGFRRREKGKYLVGDLGLLALGGFLQNR